MDAAALLDEVFIDHSCDTLKQHCDRIEDCLGKLSYQQVWRRAGDHDNSIGNLVLHLCGNLNQWIGAGVADRPDTRDRDAEFAARGGQQPAELAQNLNAAVSSAIAIIRELTAEQLAESRCIQHYNVTVLEAVYHVVEHVVEHFAQHTGQIIFAAKLLTGADLGYYKHLSNPRHTEATP
jgi:uncharacterized damage-inducible protein DinB